MLAKSNPHLRREIAMFENGRHYFSPTDICSADFLLPVRKVNSLQNITLSFLHKKFAYTMVNRKDGEILDVYYDYQLALPALNLLTIPVELKLKLSNLLSSCAFHNNLNTVLVPCRIPRYQLRPTSWLYAYVNDKTEWDIIFNDISLPLQLLTLMIRKIDKGKFRKTPSEELRMLIRNNSHVHLIKYT